jgi:DNA polymerase/3'-5' exonuclease PolX
MKLETAQAFAESILELLRQRVLKAEITGAIRRQLPEVNDIEFVILPRRGTAWIERGDFVVVQDDIGEDETIYSIAGIPCRPLDGSRWKLQVETVHDKIPMVFHIAKERDYAQAVPGNFGSIQMLTTGPEAHLNRILGRAIHLGLTWEKERGITNNIGHVTAGETETEIYAALKLDYVEPEDRK